MNAPRIAPGQILLDIVRRHPATRPVFQAWNEKAGECILCKALFETVADAAQRYGLDAEALLADLEEAAKTTPTG